MKKEALRHPKMLELASRLGVSRPCAIGHMTLLFDFVADYAPAGDVGRHLDGVISMAADWTGQPAAFIEALVASRWLDRDNEHRLLVHDWSEHCENWVRSKMARTGVEFIKTPLKSPLNTSTSDANTSLPQPSQTQPNPEPKTQPNPAKPDAHDGTSPPAKPAGSGSAGVFANGAGRKSNEQASRAPPKPPSVFDGLTPADLREPVSLMNWFEMATTRKTPVIKKSEANLLHVFGAAERALQHGSNPVGLFASLVSKAQWEKITQAQEDRARKKLKELE